MRLLRSARPSCARSAVLQCHAAPPPRWPNLPRAPLCRRASPTGLNRLCAVGPAAAASLGLTVAAHARVPVHHTPLPYCMLPGVPPGPDSCHAAATPCRARQSSVTPQRPLAGLADRCAAADSWSHGSLTQKQKKC
jgi:hypothetical protein